MTPAPALVIPLASASASKQCGEKAVALARMQALGIRVPPGLVIPASVFQEHLLAHALNTDAEALEASVARHPPDVWGPPAARLRERICAIAIADGLLAAITECRSGFAFSAGRLYAVRSSAIGEDSRSASFAGQLDSFLGIESLDALAAAIQKVWASLWSDRSLHYRQRRQVRLAGMAVIVQEQVDASISGVLFSRAPLVGTRHANRMLIECCTGLGQQLVDGSLDPVRFAIERHNGNIIDQRNEQVDPLPIDPAQLDASLRELATVAIALEVEFGGAVDVEWSLDQMRTLYILQARPITTTNVTADGATELWSNANIAENFPEPVCPLLFSIARPGYSAYFRNLGLGFGIAPQRIAAMGVALEDVIGVHGGRLYYNLTNIQRLLRLAPGGRWLGRFFNTFTGASGGESDGNDLPSRSVGSLIAEYIRIPIKVLYQYLFISQRVGRFESTVARNFQCYVGGHENLCTLFRPDSELPGLVSFPLCENQEMFSWTGLTIDCNDPHRLAAFWAAVMDRPTSEEMGVSGDWAAVGSRMDGMPKLNFQRVPEPKTTKIRVHIDLSVKDIDQAISQVERLGGTWSGTRLEYDEGIVMHMADPEGNEFCLAQYYS